MGLRAIGAAIAAILLIPATASGAVRCVDNPGGACDTNHATVQLAVIAAVSGDTIRIAPGDYVESINTPKRLTFDGAGPGSFAAFSPASHTRIRPADTTGVAPDALRLSGGGTVREIRLDGGSTDATGTAGVGLVLGPTAGPPTESYTVSNVLAQPGAGGSFGGEGIDVTDAGAVGAELSAAVSGATIRGGFRGMGQNVSFSLSRLNVATNSFFIPGVLANDGAEGTLRDSRVERLPTNDEVSRGVEATIDGAALTVERTTVVSNFHALAVVGDNARMTVRDSSAFVPDNASGGSFIGGANVAAGAFPARLELTGSTIVSVHRNGDGGVRAVGNGATAVLRNTVVRSISEQSNQADLVAREGGIITATNSAFQTRLLETGGSAPAPGSPTNIGTDARLISLTPTGLALQPSSPLIDAGGSSFVTGGELDLAGAARSLDGNGDCSARPDIGAFERPATSPALCFQAVRITNARVSNKTFAPVRRGGKVAAKKRKKRKVKRGTRFRYTLSEAATVRIVIERITRGRRITVKGKRVCGKPTRKRRKRKRCNRYRRVTTLTASQAAGRRSIPFTGRVKGKALKAGKYRARITATDLQGARSAEKRLALKIVKP